jgi:hypothetical protein
MLLEASSLCMLLEASLHEMFLLWCVLQVLQLAVCVQRYVQSALLGDLAVGFRTTITRSPLSVAEMRVAHRDYLKEVRVEGGVCHPP